MKTQQTTIYENYKMLSIDGNFLAYTSKKRMDWYIRKGLCDIIDDKTFKLNFVSEGGGNYDKSDYYQIELKNECVVCSSTEDLTKHHVVPYQYRKLLPDRYKSKSHFDVLCLCTECHEKYEREADKLKESLLVKYGLENYVKDNAKAIGFFNAITKYKHDIPENRCDEIKQFLVNFLNMDLEDIMRLETLTFKSSSEIILDNEGDMDEFVRMWRYHFIEYAKPKHLPVEWIKDIDVIF